MAEYRQVVVLDRVREGYVPSYCTHGKATCGRCSRWCWLGSESSKAVLAETVIPLCLECATEIWSPEVIPAGNINDHKRADGPHA